MGAYHLSVSQDPILNFQRHFKSFLMFLPNPNILSRKSSFSTKTKCLYRAVCYVKIIKSVLSERHINWWIPTLAHAGAWDGICDPGNALGWELSP